MSAHQHYHDTHHRYLSTACYHRQHSRCWRQCKFCSARCECGCHRQTTGAPVGSIMQPKEETMSTIDYDDYDPLDEADEDEPDDPLDEADEDEPDEQ